jgi:DNA-binding NarL/FixJ family response regulator
MRNARVYVADDHSIFRGAIVRIISELDFAQTIVEAHNGRELLSLMRIELPDLIILDLEMPSMTGFQVLDKMLGNYPEVRIIVLAMTDRCEETARALQLGAHAVVLKGSEPQEFKDAIMAIINRRDYENTIMRKAIRAFPISGISTFSSFKSDELSAREVTIVELICKEYTNKQIGYELCLSEHTIRNHKVRIMRKMGVKNASGLVKRAFQSGYVMQP